MTYALTPIEVVLSALAAQIREGELLIDRGAATDDIQLIVRGIAAVSDGKNRIERARFGAAVCRAMSAPQSGDLQ